VNRASSLAPERVAVAGATAVADASGPRDVADSGAHSAALAAPPAAAQSDAAARGRGRGLAWLIGIRVVVATLLLGSAILLQIRSQGALPADPFFLLIAVTFALTVVYALTRGFVERHAWALGLQLAVDVATVTAFVCFTGGISSYCSLLYVLPIIGGSMLLHRRGGLWLALLSGAMYGGLTVGQYALAGRPEAAWIGAAAGVLPPVRVAEYTLATNIVGFFAVALLSGSLADGLRRADRRLAQASTAIADLKAFNQHVIDSLTSGLATTDRTGRLLTFNRAAEAITGHAASSAIGRRAADVLQVPVDLTEALLRDLDGHRARRADYTYRTREGGAREIGLSATHLVTSDGRAGYLLTFQDVTEIRRLEREARRKQRLAAVGEMAAGIAHEIRNPLASLRGSIQVLRQELSLSDEQAQLMDIVLRESERLNETIRSFLSYARPQRREPARVDVGRLLEETAILLRNGSDVREDHAIDAAPGPGRVFFDADPDELRQIVWNLATNGLRAMPAGGRLTLSASIEASHANAPATLVLRVDDQGVGIPAAELDGIFQPFHGAFAGGSGLGLAIVHRIVSDHDGEIQVESSEGQGTSVRVRVPGRTAAV
jgi:two-component system sensor histidine kinase PilS (NtrC family)